MDVETPVHAHDATDRPRTEESIVAELKGEENREAFRPATAPENCSASFTTAAMSAETNVAFVQPVAAPSTSTAAPAVKARSLAAGQVNRIIDGALPDGMAVSRDARIAMQKCATISLFYLAYLADAERKAAKSSRTTLNVQDIRAAMEAAGMAHLVPLMTTAAKRSRD